MQAVPVLCATLAGLVVAAIAVPAVRASVHPAVTSRRTVATGIEVLRAKRFGPLVGKRVAVKQGETK